jgi:hypothetical protein
MCIKKYIGNGRSKLTSCDLDLELPNGDVNSQAQRPSPLLETVHRQPQEGDANASTNFLVDPFDAHGDRDCA